MVYYVVRDVGLERKLQIKKENVKSDRKRFTEELCEIILATLGEEYQTELTVVRKNNGVMKEVLYIRKKDSECMPCFYTDELYLSYCNGENEVGLADHMVNIVLNECETVRREVQKYLTKDWIAEHLFLRLVQIEKNREWLEEAVYVSYLDLAAVVYVLTEDSENGVKSFLLPKSTWDILQVGTPEDYFPRLVENTARLLKTLQIENDLEEIVKLVGMDALSADDRITLEVARSIREDFLQQNAFEEDDSYTPLEKQAALINLIFAFEDKARVAVAAGVDAERIASLEVRETIGRAKAVPFEEYRQTYAKIEAELTAQMDALIAKAEEA